MLLVFTVRVTLRSGLVAVTVTPGTTWPDVSVTRPVMSPVVTWANAAYGMPDVSNARSIAVLNTRKDNMANLLEDARPPGRVIPRHIGYASIIAVFRQVRSKNALD